MRAGYIERPRTPPLTLMQTFFMRSLSQRHTGRIDIVGFKRSRALGSATRDSEAMELDLMKYLGWRGRSQLSSHD